MKLYFTSDGTYGPANDSDIAIVDVAEWTNDMLMDIEEESDSQRMELAIHFARGEHDFVARSATYTACTFCMMTPEQLGL